MTTSTEAIAGDDRAARTLERFMSAVDRIGALPLFDQEATRLTTALGQENGDLSDIMAHLATDPELGRQLIEMATSVLGPKAAPVRSAGQAAMVLGVDVIAQLSATVRLDRSLASAASVCDPARQIVARTRFAEVLSQRMQRAAVEDPNGPAILKNRQLGATGSERRDSDQFAQDGVRAGGGVGRLSEQLRTMSGVCSMGQLLCAYYLPEDWHEIQRMATSDRVSVHEAFLRHLGISADALALYAGRKFHLPAQMLELLELLSDERVETASLSGTLRERIALVARFARDMAMLVEQHALAGEIDAVCERYQDRLGIEAQELARTTRALQDDPVLAREIDAILGTEIAGFGRSVKPADAALRLDRSLSALQPVTSHLDDVNRLLTRLVDLLHRSFGAQRVALFVRQLSVEYYRARWFAGHFDDDHRFAAFGPGAGHEMIDQALRTRRPVFVADCNAPGSHRRLSVFMVQHFGNARARGVIPVVVGQRVPMMLYLDWDRETSVSPSEMRALTDFASTIAMVLQAIRHGERTNAA